MQGSGCSGVWKSTAHSAMALSAAVRVWPAAASSSSCGSALIFSVAPIGTSSVWCRPTIASCMATSASKRTMATGTESSWTSGVVTGLASEFDTAGVSVVERSSSCLSSSSWISPSILPEEWS